MRTQLTDLLVVYTKRAIVKAQRLGNTDLEQSLDHPPSYYMAINTAQCIARANAVKNLLKANLAQLTNITTADIDAIEKAIVAFEAEADAPRTTKQKKKIYGTDQISQLLDKTDIYITNMGNLVDSYYYNYSLSAEFLLKSKATEAGARSNHVHLSIRDAATGTPVAGSIARNASGTKAAEGTPEGNAHFESIRRGAQEFTVTAPGYAPATVKVKVQRGTTTEGVVKMEKV